LITKRELQRIRALYREKGKKETLTAAPL